MGHQHRVANSVYAGVLLVPLQPFSFQCEFMLRVDEPGVVLPFEKSGDGLGLRDGLGLVTHSAMVQLMLQLEKRQFYVGILRF